MNGRTETQSVAQWKPESPFLEETSYNTPAPSGGFSVVAEVLPSPFLGESPFPSAYAGEQAPADPQAMAFAELTAEFYDTEFEDVVARFAQEVYEIVDRDRSSRSFGAVSVAELEAGAMDTLTPTARELEAALDRLGEAAGDLDTARLSETEVEELFARFAPPMAPNAEFDYFLKGLWNKAKKVVGGVVKTAKRAVSAGLKAVSKVLPLKQILGALKKLVRPLIQKVLKVAIDKLPEAVRPAARKLAAAFLGKDAAPSAKPATTAAPAPSAPAAPSATPAQTPPEAAPDVGTQPPSAPSTEDVQGEFDSLMASYVLTGGETEPQFEFEAAGPGGEPAPTVQQLDQAREQFARAMGEVEPTAEAVAPHIQQFIPAVLAAAPVAIAAAKTAISIIGRDRVVGMLAGLVSKLVQKFVGKEAAPALSRAMVDTGMKLIGFETPPPNMPGYVVAQTVEDTVHRFAELVDRYDVSEAELVQSPVLREALVTEAFNSAVSANFPSQLIKPELREVADYNAAWVLMPPHGTKYYKKYTRILDVTVDPKTAERITTFGGSTLADFLYGSLRLPRGPVKARMHLYEAIPGTWLSRITLYERNVPGLGSAREHAWSQIHPLTTAAAGMIAGSAGLGRDVSSRYTQSRHVIGVGQRFYYLEIAGARPSPGPYPGPRPGPAPGPGPGPAPSPDRPSQVNVVIDCQKNEIRVYLYYSEAVTQQIAGSLRRSEPMSSVLRIIAGNVAAVSNTIAEGPGNHVRIIQEFEAWLLPVLKEAAKRLLPIILKWLAKQVVKWILKKLAEYIEQKAAEFRQAFLQAADSPENGVTLYLIFKNPPGLPVLCKILRGETTMPSLPDLTEVPAATVGIRPGFVRD